MDPGAEARLGQRHNRWLGGCHRDSRIIETLGCGRARSWDRILADFVGRGWRNRKLRVILPSRVGYNTLRWDGNCLHGAWDSVAVHPAVPSRPHIHRAWRRRNTCVAEYLAADSNQPTPGYSVMNVFPAGEPQDSARRMVNAARERLRWVDSLASIVVLLAVLGFVGLSSVLTTEGSASITNLVIVIIAFIWIPPVAHVAQSVSLRNMSTSLAIPWAGRLLKQRTLDLCTDGISSMSPGGRSLRPTAERRFG